VPDKQPTAWSLKESPVPDDCLACRRCGSKSEMYCEEPVLGDWHGRGRVVRIGCTCDDCMEEFEKAREPFSAEVQDDGTFHVEVSEKEVDAYFEAEAELRTDFLPPLEAIAQWNRMQQQQ